MTGGHLIRAARQRAAISQEELARRLGTSQSVIARWETGRRSPTLETVIDAVRACGFDLDVSLSARDRDHERLIADALRRSPEERLAHHADLVDLERRLHAATRAS